MIGINSRCVMIIALLTMIRHINRFIMSMRVLARGCATYPINLGSVSIVKSQVQEY